MFRGGPVNSEGTGITSGLNQGYANGGRIGYEGPTADNNYNLVTPSYDEFGINMSDLINDTTRSNIPTTNTSIIQTRDDKIKEYNEKLKKELEQGTTTNIGINPATGLPWTPRDRLKLEPNISDLAKKEGFDISSGTAREQIEKRKTFEEYLKTKKNQPVSSKSDVLTDVNSLFYKQNAAKEGIDEDAQFDKFYNRAYKALGGEKAGTQAIFDAMLAASPGFFKGRTLTEAAPNVLEGILKSGAFDRPQKIKQAAAEIALTRQIGLEKIQEQEKARLALLNQKLMGPQTMQNDIAKIQANLKAGPNPITVLGEAPSAIKGVNLNELNNNKEASDYIDKQSKGRIILVEDKQGIQNYILVTGKDKNNKSIWTKVGEKGIGKPTLSSGDIAALSGVGYRSSVE
jgi:hypothetical protein